MGGLANSIALGMMVGGTATSAVGRHQAGQAAERSARFNAQMARRDTFDQLEAMFGEARRRRSQNVTRVAKSGVRLEGSPLAVLAENEYQEQRQRDFVKESGLLRSEIMATQARNAETATRVGIASEVLGGLGRTASVGLRHA